MHYADLIATPLPDHGGRDAVMAALWQALHASLVKTEETRVGVLFPEHSSDSLGGVLRLIGPSDALSRALAGMALMRFEGAIKRPSLAAVPNSCAWVSVRRVQAKASVDRARRRLARRFPGQGLEQKITAHGSAGRQPCLPSLALRSSSTKQPHYRVYVSQSAADGAVEGEFNSFGLSKTATLPLF